MKRKETININICEPAVHTAVQCTYNSVDIDEYSFVYNHIRILHTYNTIYLYMYIYKYTQERLHDINMYMGQVYSYGLYRLSG